MEVLNHFSLRNKQFFRVTAGNISGDTYFINKYVKRIQSDNTEVWEKNIEGVDLKDILVVENQGYLLLYGIKVNLS